MVEPASGGDLLDLYERWRRDHSRRDARKLVAAGVVLGSRGAALVH